jgi:hypothetical protein
MRNEEVMSMKRFLILFTLIAFSVVSCAGPNREMRLFTKPDFNHDEYEKDRQECNDQSFDQNLDSDARWQAYLDCLAEKGYKYQTSQDAEKTKEEPTTKERIITAGQTVGMVLLGVIVVTLYLGLMFLPRK